MENCAYLRKNPGYAPGYVLLQIFNLMMLYFWKTGENKIFHFIFIFVSLSLLMISNY